MALITELCLLGYRAAPSIDLVLISHGDLAHSGLYAYAYSHWGLTAPAYTTLPVQAMARVAATEDVEGIRDEEAVDPEVPDAEEEQAEDSVSPDAAANGAMDIEDTTDAARRSASPKASTPPSGKRKYVATVQQVHEAFDSVNGLRYSQPCHLQGTFPQRIPLPHLLH